MMFSIFVLKCVAQLGKLLGKPVGGVVGEVCRSDPSRNMAADAQRLGRHIGFVAGHAVDALACGVRVGEWPGTSWAYCPPKSP